MVYQCTVGPLIIELPWVKIRVSEVALEALDDPSGVQPKIWTTGGVSVNIMTIAGVC